MLIEQALLACLEKAHNIFYFLKLVELMLDNLGLAIYIPDVKKVFYQHYKENRSNDYSNAAGIGLETKSK